MNLYEKSTFTGKIQSIQKSSEYSFLYLDRFCEEYMNR